MKTVFTLRCVDNSGECYTPDDTTVPMETCLTIGKEYTGKVSDTMFFTVDDRQETGIFDIERFTFVF